MLCFSKKCWHIKKDDTYNFCKDFQPGLVDLVNLSDSLITLILALSKLLANWFRSVLEVVHKNQYDFYMVEHQNIIRVLAKKKI